MSTFAKLIQKTNQARRARAKADAISEEAKRIAAELAKKHAHKFPKGTVLKDTHKKIWVRVHRVVGLDPRVLGLNYAGLGIDERERKNPFVLECQRCTAKGVVIDNCDWRFVWGEDLANWEVVS